MRVKTFMSSVAGLMLLVAGAAAPGLAQASQYGYDRGHHHRQHQSHNYRHDSHRYCPPRRHAHHRQHFNNHNNYYYGRPYFRGYNHQPHRNHNGSGFSIYYSR